MPRLLLTTTLVAGCALAACKETAAPLAIPEAPDNIFLTTRLEEIHVTWPGTRSTADIFQIEMATGDSSFVVLGLFPLSAERAVVKNAQGGTIYRFRVSACNRAGCSAGRELTLDTRKWLRPTIVSARPSLDDVGGLRIILQYLSHDLHSETKVTVKRADGSGAPLERGESVPPTLESISGQQTRTYFFAGLAPGAEYVFFGYVANEYGATQIDQQRVFMDYAIPVITVSEVITLTRTAVTIRTALKPGLAGASLFGEVVPADSAYQLNASSPYSSAIRTFASESDANTVVEFSFVRIVRPGTDYKARIWARNGAGVTAYYGDILFRSLP